MKTLNLRLDSHIEPDVKIYKEFDFWEQSFAVHKAYNHNKNCFVEEYSVSHIWSGSSVLPYSLREKTIKAAIEKAKTRIEFFAKNKEKLKDLVEHWYWSHQEYPTAYQKSKFKECFKENLADYFHPFFKFEITKFDELLKVPNGISTKDHIFEKYGYDALKLIEDLMKNRIGSRF